jgi:prephenate dehydrogenase
VSGTAVVGLGLIGGSLALAAGARGYDRDPDVRARARARGIDAADSLEAAVAGVEIVVTAVPTAQTPELLRALSILAPGAVLTDTASLKRPIVEAMAALGPATRCVAGHPMAGARRRGIEAAAPEIFRGRPWVLVRTPRSDDASMAAVSDLVVSIGARPVFLDAERHDRLMTWVSHLPHAVASALAAAAGEAAGDDLARLAGPGLLDTTRLAGQPVALALELALADPGALAAAIDAVRAELGSLSAALRAGDGDPVRALFEEAEAIRRAMEG